MHRLAAQPGSGEEADAGAFVEQPPAPVLLLSSADTDLLAIDQLLQSDPALLGCELRALNLAALSHPALVDHYLVSTARHARVVLVRLLGGRGHWSYGLDALQRWARSPHPAGGRRSLLVLAGTAEDDQALAELGTGPPELALALAACLRVGGPANLRAVLRCLRDLLEGAALQPPIPQPLPDPLPHDWRDDPGARVGLIVYRALLQAGDLSLMDGCLEALRQQGLAPRALWVSGLREQAVQSGVADLLARERVEAVLCCTSFASVQLAEAGLGAPLWERLGVPVLQVLSSGRSRASWAASSIGLGPMELGLQVALPELDGRLTTRIGAFKECDQVSERLVSALPRYVPDRERLAWIAQLTANWIHLRRTPAPQRRVALVLANYPNRNSRIANGVGLDTPASTALMLAWLQQAGYGTGAGLPADGQQLIEALLAVRSNDPESGHRPPLDHLPLTCYLQWYATLPCEGRERLEAVWGPPAMDQGLEPDPDGRPAFPVRGLRFGHVALLLQPERGYDRDPSLNYHSPDLPPTHAYLAQYLWMRESFAAQVVVHVGKHGNLEWLPGKGLGLSGSCFPEWALGPLPHLYPFIVNDPGEGSQAKRRSQAVILDHLTPPLGRAGLHGDLQALDALLDEYWDAVQLGGERAQELRQQLERQIRQLELPQADGAGDLDGRLDAADGYLCELKEAQIRLGLHTYGQLPEAAPLVELLLCLARPPQDGHQGFTQAIALDLGLELDPWSDPEEQALSDGDQRLLAELGDGERLRLVGDGVALLDTLALGWLAPLIEAGDDSTPCAWAAAIRPGANAAAALERIRTVLLPRLLACGTAEREAFLSGVGGGRIAAGPSGAPTRGRPDLLPTGRNFYSVDLRGLPSETAWDLGRRSAELLLELHLQDEGEHLQRLALSVWGTATMRNGGEDIAQALALIGVRPMWDGPTRRLVDLEVIPLALLGRPRVDVTLRISGLFRDAFPQLVGWFNHACALIAALDEPAEANPLAASAAREGGWARVYGSAPGAYGAGLQGLIDSGQWDSRADLAEAFLTWSAWRYDGGSNGSGTGSGQGPIEASADRSGLEQRLRQVQVVLHNQDNREHDLLDSDDYYQFQGGLSAAVETLSGQAPQLWFADHSRHSRPRVHRLEKEFDKVLRSRLLNPRWIEGMQRHGYKGGFELAASLDYLFAYDASTGRVPDWSYGRIADSWLRDAGVRVFLEQANPWALRDMAERLLEANHRGLWTGATEPQLADLRQLVLDSEARIEQR
ncbi:MAG: cobaltochelatase subunit CobN [Cyanobacteriota bacterium]|nr:cobaltochelatase subunit CobN [Cyanobacteriota bacterium]